MELTNLLESNLILKPSLLVEPINAFDFFGSPTLFTFLEVKRKQAAAKLITDFFLASQPDEFIDMLLSFRSSNDLAANFSLLQFVSNNLSRLSKFERNIAEWDFFEAACLLLKESNVLLRILSLQAILNLVDHFQLPFELDIVISKLFLLISTNLVEEETIYCLEKLISIIKKTKQMVSNTPYVLLTLFDQVESTDVLTLVLELLFLIESKLLYKALRSDMIMATLSALIDFEDVGISEASLKLLFKVLHSKANFANNFIFRKEFLMQLKFVIEREWNYQAYDLILKMCDPAEKEFVFVLIDAGVCEFFRVALNKSDVILRRRTLQSMSLLLKKLEKSENEIDIAYLDLIFNSYRMRKIVEEIEDATQDKDTKIIAKRILMI